MRKRRLWAVATVALVVITLVGCTTTKLTTAGAKVRLTSNPEIVRGCRFVGEVKGSSHFNWSVVGNSSVEEGATNELKNEAGRLGGDVLLLTTSSVGAGGATMRGEAYQCGGVKPE